MSGFQGTPLTARGDPRIGGKLPTLVVSPRMSPERRAVAQAIFVKYARLIGLPEDLGIRGDRTVCGDEVAGYVTRQACESGLEAR